MILDQSQSDIYSKNPHIRTTILRSLRLKFSVMYHLNIRYFFRQEPSPASNSRFLYTGFYCICFFYDHLWSYLLCLMSFRVNIYHCVCFVALPGTQRLQIPISEQLASIIKNYSVILTAKMLQRSVEIALIMPLIHVHNIFVIFYYSPWHLF